MTPQFRLRAVMTFCFVKSSINLSLQQCNDVSLMTYLGTMTKGCNTINQVMSSLQRQKIDYGLFFFSHMFEFKYIIHYIHERKPFTKTTFHAVVDIAMCSLASGNNPAERY